MKKRKRNVIVSLALAACLLLSGCGGQVSQESTSQNSGAGPSPSGVEEQAGVSAGIVEKTDATDLPPVSRRVCFIGNSLIDYGSQAGFLEDIAWGFGQNIKVDQITWGGAYLRDYLRGTLLPKKEVRERLGQADIVVFQDYGGWRGNTTVRAIRKLEKWCRKDAKLYYYMYEDDNWEMSSSDYQTLKKLKLSFVPKGQMIELLYEFGYTYEDLHLEGDFHPNSLNGYLSALMMYAVLFQEKCVSLPREWFPTERSEAPRIYIDLEQSFHGSTSEEKWDEFQRICQRMDEQIAHPEKSVSPDAMREISHISEGGCGDCFCGFLCSNGFRYFSAASDIACAICLRSGDGESTST